MSELAKAYEPQPVESKWYQHWLDEKFFVADPARVSATRPAYSIVIPPPNVTGVLTMGHVLNNTIQDILARKARMDGKEVLWLPGTDHAGIATQNVVEKTMKKAGEIKHRNDLGREALVAKIWEWKEKYGGIILQQLRALGASCDWTRTRFTMDPEYSRCVQKVFVDLYKKGLIYRGKRMVNWCPASLTALSDEEVIMKEQKGFMYHFKVEVAESSSGRSRGNEAHSNGERGTGNGEQGKSLLTPAATGEEKKASGPVTDAEGRIWLTIATTRPETIPGDTAVAVNPKDPRYAHLIGKHIVRPLPVELPREQRLIPIIGDEHVDFEFGTGVLKVTPAHDKADFEIGQRHTLPVVEVIEADGKMNALAGQDLNGLDRFAARKLAVEKLTELGSLEKQEPYTNNVGYSERADVPIEPRLSEQWFLKYPSVDASKKCVAGGDMKFFPDRWAKVYDHWMGGIQDWCISRQLWWGHRIPVWYNDEARRKLNQTVPIVAFSGRELGGANIKELRDAAWAFATQHGFLNHTFHNDDTGWEILVRPASLEHAFTHLGPANIKVTVVLPEIIRTAIKIGSLHHAPINENLKAVHLFVGAASIDGEIYRVKITVKEHINGQKLYDHHLFKIGTPDGKSPMPAALASEPARPASGAGIPIAALFENVNADPSLLRCQIDEPGPDWTQDPDVLDTWFSSWLWPFATMGWTGDKDTDAKNPTLKAFYPTTDLVTGPDIIFFWVARMIMAGYEYMGDLPFRNVYFTGIIRDKNGQKMSKSLGNSPDPLALINGYGADAVRFGVMRAIPLGQDLIFEDREFEKHGKEKRYDFANIPWNGDRFPQLELARNFCNKLWNACRFRQMQGGEVQGEIDVNKLRADDKWILLKLHAAIKELDTAFAEYRFSDATQALYRFFYNEYCDWYVESCKAVLQSGSRRGDEADGSGATASPPPHVGGYDDPKKANVVAVMDFVLAHTLRLFHPFLPFITEELWHGMGYATDMPDAQGGRSIMHAPWPKPFDTDFRDHYSLDDCYLEFVDAKFDLISKGRNLRAEARIAANKKVKFIFKADRELPPNDIEVIQLLLNAETLEINPGYVPGKGVSSVKAEMGELYLPLEGLVDTAAELARLTKELEKIVSEITKVEQKLANPGFTQKVPPEVLAEHQKRREDWIAKRQHVQQALDGLRG